MQLKLERTTIEQNGIPVSTLGEVTKPQKREQIAALAYEFWQARGCPYGTPDEDWFRAGWELAVSQRKDEKEVGSRDSPEPLIADDEADSPVARFPVRSEICQTARPKNLRQMRKLEL